MDAAWDFAPLENLPVLFLHLRIRKSLVVLGNTLRMLLFLRTS